MRRWALRAFRLLPPRLRRSVVRVWAPSYTVGAICVVTHGAETLLVRHAYRRHWGAPGGLLDRGELPERAAVREVGEEVGLAVGLIAGPVPVVWPAYRRIDLVYRGVLDVGMAPSDARPTSVEIVECRWFRVDALPALQPDTEEALRVLGIGPDADADADG